MSAGPNHFAIRPDWLASQSEQLIDVDQPLIDTHHHLYERPGLRYLLEDYLADTAGLPLQSSVFVQARAMLPEGVAPEWQPVGEVEFAGGIAAMSASGIYGPTRICAGIVGFADLTLGDRVRPVLERMLQVSSRLRGIRQTLCWDRDTPLLNPAYPTTPDMADSPSFRAGFAHLAALGLRFEIWAFYHQLQGLARLARAYPQVPMVVNHMGGVLRIRGHANADVFGQWRAGIDALATCPNVHLKLSGLGMRISGFDLDASPTAPTSDKLAQLWAPWVRLGIEAFGPDRCMWGSNFPVDKGSYSFKIGLNAMKRLVASASAAERDAIFCKTGKTFYRLQD